MRFKWLKWFGHWPKWPSSLYFSLYQRKITSGEKSANLWWKLMKKILSTAVLKEQYHKLVLTSVSFEIIAIKYILKLLLTAILQTPALKMTSQRKERHLQTDRQLDEWTDRVGGWMDGQMNGQMERQEKSDPNVSVFLCWKQKNTCFKTNAGDLTGSYKLLYGYISLEVTFLTISKQYENKYCNTVSFQRTDLAWILSSWYLPHTESFK